MSTPHLCSEPYCTAIVEGAGRCPEHARGWDRWTGPEGAYGSAWRKARDAYIREHPRCETPGCAARASEVHHVNHDPTDHRAVNLMSLCLAHHRSETGRAGALARQASAGRRTSSSDRRAK